MTLFTNPNFIDHIVKSQGAHDHLQPDSYPLIQALVEFETRKLIEIAIKFMRHQKRQILTQEDIDCALFQMGYQDSILQLDDSQYLTIDGHCQLEDKLFTSPEELFREEMKILGTVALEAPKIKGHWIYIKGKIPSTNENAQMINLAQLTYSKFHENQEKKKLFNIIKDDPLSLLTKEQLDYYKKIVEMISNNNLPPNGFEIQGNVVNLMPFFLKLLAHVELNDTAILFLVRLVENQYVWKNLDFHLKQVIAVFMSYKGSHSLMVGFKIAEIVKRFCDKYPILFDIYEDYHDETYSTILKKIAFELVMGVPVELSSEVLAKCKHDAEYNDEMAIFCMRAIATYSSQLSLIAKKVARKEQTSFYWHPTSEMQLDPYMNML